MASLFVLETGFAERTPITVLDQPIGDPWSIGQILARETIESRHVVYLKSHVGANTSVSDFRLKFMKSRRLGGRFVFSTGK